MNKWQLLIVVILLSSFANASFEEATFVSKGDTFNAKIETGFSDGDVVLVLENENELYTVVNDFSFEVELMDKLSIYFLDDESYSSVKNYTGLIFDLYEMEELNVSNETLGNYERLLKNKSIESYRINLGSLSAIQEDESIRFYFEEVNETLELRKDFNLNEVFQSSADNTWVEVARLQDADCFYDEDESSSYVLTTDIDLNSGSYTSDCEDSSWDTAMEVDQGSSKTYVEGDDIIIYDGDDEEMGQVSWGAWQQVSSSYNGLSRRVKYKVDNDGGGSPRTEYMDLPSYCNDKPYVGIIASFGAAWDDDDDDNIDDDDEETVVVCSTSKDTSVRCYDEDRSWSGFQECLTNLGTWDDFIIGDLRYNYPDTRSGTEYIYLDEDYYFYGMTVEVLAECTSGVCCNTGSYTYKSSSTVCNSNAGTEYGCPWGNDLGDDVGKRTKTQSCSGSSGSCSGSTTWGSWSVHESCNSNEKCENGACVCVPDWDCGEWGFCIQGNQTRTCVDNNNCGTDEGKPTESQSCTEACMRTNVVGGTIMSDWYEDGSWISIDTNSDGNLDAFGITGSTTGVNRLCDEIPGNTVLKVLPGDHESQYTGNIYILKYSESEIRICRNRDLSNSQYYKYQSSDPDAQNANTNGCNYIECSLNTDCGTDGYPNGNYCQGNDVYGDHYAYTCSSPGTYYSVCSTGINPTLIEICEHGCSNGACITNNPQETFDCYDGNVYWYDSLGNRGELKEDCNYGCSGGECLANPQETYDCYNGDVYWYDSSDNRGELKEDCHYDCQSKQCIYQGYPGNVDVGVGSNIVFSESNYYVGPENINFKTALENFLAGCTPDSEGNCDVPVSIMHNGRGSLIVENIAIYYGENKEQTYSYKFLPGWNFFSIPLNLSYNPISSLNYEKIKTADWEKLSNESFELSYKEAYMIKVNEDIELNVSGKHPISGCEIELVEGWNSVPYLNKIELPIVEALESIDGKYTVVRNAFNEWSENVPEFARLQTMRPRQGYWIDMSEGGTLVYPESVCKK